MAASGTGSSSMHTPRSAPPKETRNLYEHIDETLDDTAYEAAAEHPPLAKMAVAVFELIGGIVCNIVQVATSAFGLFAMAEGAGYRFTSVSDVLHAQPYIFGMSILISFVVQALLHKNSQAISSTYMRLRHIQHFNIKSTSARAEVKNALTFGNIIFLLALATEVVSDGTYARLYTREWFFVLAWIVMLSAGSTLLLYDGFIRGWGAWEDWKDYGAYFSGQQAPK